MPKLLALDKETIASAFRLVRAKERTTVSEFAEKHRLLSNEGGGYVGPWDNDVAPYLTEPMDCLTSLRYLTICLAGPGQSGKTEIAQNWLLRSIMVDPGDFLWFMQSDDSLEAYVKTRINVMIEKHGRLKKALGTRPIDDSLHYKKFDTMDVEFLTATQKNLINKSAPRIVADEIDNYNATIGNVKPLLDIRRQTFGAESKLLIVSHPDRARGMTPERDWTEGVMSVYADSDRRMWYWKCPHCGCYSSPCPAADRYMVVDYPEDGTLDEIQEKACLVCPVNGCVITEAERLRLNRTGKWVGIGQEISLEGEVTGELVKRDTAGFWVVGVMSPFILGGVGGLARARVKAEREFEASGDDKTLKEVMTKQWGVPYVPPRSVGSVTANDLVERATPTLKLKQVPQAVRFLTAAIDIQKAHFDVLVRGWGVRGESWIIDRMRIGGDPAANPEDWDKIIDKVINAVYPIQHVTGKGMKIRAVAFDSGGAPGVTRQAYDFWTRCKRQNLVRNYGTIAGREAFSILPLKGANSINAKRLTVTYPDTVATHGTNASKGTVPVGMFNPNNFKDDLMGQLRRADDGAWTVHFPADLKSKEPPHEWFEELVAEHRKPNGRWEKINPHHRNEATDLMVMNHVIAYLHGVSLIRWDSPPPWAMPWNDNTFVVNIEMVASTEKSGNNARQEEGVKIVTDPDKKPKSLSSLLP